MADFDAIVVGAGCAGSIAAYELAKAGKSVLMVERGNYAGAKNMTGGRIYTHALKEVFPNFEKEAPLERRIVNEKISLLSNDANFTVAFTSADMRVSGKDSYSVLRGSFDQWLASKAEDSGVEAVYGIPVEILIKDDNGRVVGIRAGEDEITAEVTILCDGVNSLLAAQAVGASRPPAAEMAVGIKQVIALPAHVISDRCLASDDGEGAAWLFSGDATHGSFGGGFIYTNKESISIGIVAGIESTIDKGTCPVYQMMEDFKNNPAVAPIIKGGTVVEYSGHMVPEGGINIMPSLVNDGVLLAGESANMCVNLGYQVRGMDYAVAAGMHAGREAAKAIDAGDTSKEGLSGYVSALENSFVLQDLRRYRRVPSFMSDFTRMFNEYPVAARDAMNALFVVDGKQGLPLREKMKPIVKSVGIVNALRDVRGAMKAL